MRQEWVVTTPGEWTSEHKVVYDLAHRPACPAGRLHRFEDVLGYGRFWASLCQGCGAMFPPTLYLLGRHSPSRAEDAKWDAWPVDGNYEPGGPEIEALLAARPLVAYKLVDEAWESPFSAPWGAPKIRYEVGRAYEADAVDEDPEKPCGAGLHAGTLGWCARNWSPGLRLLEVTFAPEDIACVPKKNGGKIRLRRLTVARERDDVKPCEACVEEKWAGR